MALHVSTRNYFTKIKEGCQVQKHKKSSLVSFIVKRPWAGASITHSQFLQSKLMLYTKKAPPEGGKEG